MLVRQPWFPHSVSHQSVSVSLVSSKNCLVNVFPPALTCAKSTISNTPAVYGRASSESPFSISITYMLTVVSFRVWHALLSVCRRRGIDVLGWLDDASTMPSMSYLCSAPVSYPLIFATQMAHYCNALKHSGATHAQLLGVLKGATGHSQGVVAAAVISSSTTDADLLTRSAAAARYMLWQGTRCHQVLRADVRYVMCRPPSALQWAPRSKLHFPHKGFAVTLATCLALE